mgnify:CR=1 FL=1
MIRTVLKTLIGKVQMKRFQVQAGKNVYIGKNCALEGKNNIVLEDGVTVRPYTQIWSEGGR